MAYLLLHEYKGDMSQLVEIGVPVTQPISCPTCRSRTMGVMEIVGDDEHYVLTCKGGRIVHYHITTRNIPYIRSRISEGEI